MQVHLGEEITKLELDNNYFPNNLVPGETSAKLIAISTLCLVQISRCERLSAILTFCT